MDHYGGLFVLNWIFSKYNREAESFSLPRCFLCLGNVGSAGNQWGDVDMDFSDEFLVNNHISVFSERLIYSSVIVIGGSLFSLFFLTPSPSGHSPYLICDEQRERVKASL